MNDHQVHWIEGGGLPGLPAGSPRLFSGTRDQTTLKVRELRAACDAGGAHSISVFYVSAGIRLNVTGDFVTFDSRPRRPAPGVSDVAVLGKRIERGAYK